MKISLIIAAGLVSGAFAFAAPSAEAMPRGQAPVETSQAGDVQLVHGRHCRIKRGHRSRCRVKRRTHRHRHCHRRCHVHRHRSGHHHSGRRYRSRGRPRFGIYLGF